MWILKFYFESAISFVNLPYAIIEKNCSFFKLIFFMKHHLTKLISRDLMFRTVLCSHKREMKGEKQLY